MRKERIIPAGKFKAECLQLMNYVNEKHTTILITKRGVPIAKLVPIEKEPINLFGALKGSLKIKEDIIMPIDEEWDAEK